MSGPSAVAARGLTKRFGGPGDGVLAVDRLDLDIPAGSVFGLLGPNGAGKTTTLRLLIGLARPSAGSATIDGVVVRPDDPAIRRSVGVLDQAPRFYGWMRGRELVELAARLAGLDAPAARRRAAAALDQAGLATDAGRRIAGYSGGMRQRLGIAAALVAEPTLLILDEPVSSLDPGGRRDLLTLIADLRGVATVVFSTHVLDDVERICDRVAILDHGRLIKEAPLDDLLATVATASYRLEPWPGQTAAVAALRAALTAAPWCAGVTETDGGLVVTVRDEAAAAAGLLPMVVGRGRPPHAVRTGPAHPRGRLPPARRRRRDRADPTPTRRARLMAAWSILLGKELLESWRTYRLPVVLGLFALVGLSSPLLARFLPEIIRATAGDALVAIPSRHRRSPTRPPRSRRTSASSGRSRRSSSPWAPCRTELERGTAAFLLARPIGRGAFLGAKALAIGLVLLAAVLVAVALGWIYTAILFEPPPIAGWLAMAGLAWLALAAWAAITFLASVVTGSTGAAAGIGFVALLVLSIASVVPALGRLTPAGLTGPATALATGSASVGDLGMDLWVPVLATIVLIAVCLAGAVAAFRRREL